MQPRAGVLTSIGLVAFAACDGQTRHSPETPRQYEWADVAHTNEVIPECFPEDPVRVARICDMALEVDAFLVLGVDELTQVTEPLIFNGEEMAPEECGSVGHGDWATGTQIWSFPQIPDDQAFFLSGLPEWFDIVGKAVILPVWLNEDGAFVQRAEPLAMTNGHLVEPPCVN